MLAKRGFTVDLYEARDGTYNDSVNYFNLVELTLFLLHISPRVGDGLGSGVTSIEHVHHPR